MLRHSTPSVSSSTYDLLLKGLLGEEPPLIGVKALAQSQEEYVLLDTRSHAEFSISHIPTSQWIGYEEFDIAFLENIPRDQKIVCYCSVGYRSGKIGLKLRELGFEQVYNLYGGIFEWNNQGLKLIDMQNRETQKLHVYNKVWGIWSNASEKVYGTKQSG
ncbi:MAG: rhodanese-like domain-containing protein [Bacteroidota bacterium]